MSAASSLSANRRRVALRDHLKRYERGSIIITSNLPFDEWAEVFGSERLTGSIQDCLTHHVHILEMNGESFRLRQSRKVRS
jgi:DNA replication protein DnaC